MKLKYLLALAVISSGPLMAWAENSSSSSLRETALSESKVDGPKSSKSSGPVVEGMLKLEDPRLRVVTRSWDYSLKFSLQEFQPRGKVTTEYQDHFNLSEDGSSVMPALALGFLKRFPSTTAWHWRAGAEARFAYSTQSATGSFNEGHFQNDARINSLALSAHPFVGLSHEKWSWCQLLLGVEYGDLTYTQTSSNDLATFSKQVAFAGWTAGLDFQLSPAWALTTEYARRDRLSSASAIDIQKNNFEIGTRVTW